MALGAETEKLQPMLMDFKAARALQAAAELFKVIAAEYFHPSAGLAQQQMLVAFQRRYVSMATVGAVHSLDQAQFLELFQCSIYRHQSKAFMPFQAYSIEVGSRQRLVGRGQHFDHRPARTGEPVTVGLQTLQPLQGFLPGVRFGNDLRLGHVGKL